MAGRFWLMLSAARLRRFGLCRWG